MGYIQKISKRLGFNAMEFMIAIAIGFGVIALIVYGANSVGNNYNTTVISPEFNSSFNKFTDISNATSSMFEDISSGDSLELSSLVSIFAFTKAATRVLGIFFEMPAMMISFFSQSLIQLGIDPFLASIIQGIIMTIITIIIVFVIVSFLTRSRV